MLFLPKPTIGLDISDSSIEAAYVIKKGDRLVLASYGRVVLPPGLIVDGQIVKMEELCTILHQLLTEQMIAPLPEVPKRVVFALPESKVFSHVFEVPRAVDENELYKTLAVEADGYFPYSHGEMVSGLSIISESPNAKQVYFAAVPRDALSQYLEFFAKCDLEVVVVEGEATSMARAVFRRDEPDATVLADIGARVTTLSIFDNNGIQFSESFPIAGDAFTSAVAETMKVPLEYAEEIKRANGLSGEMGLPALKSLTVKVEELVANIEGAISFYETRSHRQVKRAYICGGSILLPGLFAYIGGKLSSREHPIETRVVDPLRDIIIDQSLEAVGVRGRSVLLATAVGLGLRGAGVSKFSEINFLTSAQRIAAREGSATKSKTAPSAKPLAPLLVKPTSTVGARHWSKPLKISLIVLTILAVATLAWAAAFIVVPKFMGANQANNAPRPVNIVFDFTVGPEPMSLADYRLQATYLSASTEISHTFERQASKTEAKAKGRIKIYNDGAAVQTLIPSTRLVSEGGVVFRLDERVSVRPRSSVEVAVTADQVGASGDVGPGPWTIPGLPVAQQSIVYGLSTEAMTGGEVSNGEPITQAELETAKTSLATMAETELRRQIASNVEAESFYVDSTFHTVNVTVLAGPKVGETVSSYTLKAKVEAAATAYDKAELIQLVEVLAREALGTTEGNIDPTSEFSPKVINSTSDAATLHFDATVSLK